MNYVTALQTISVNNENINFIEDLSDNRTGMKRARVHFHNGYQLSIISGPFSYGGSDGLFEIAIFNNAGNYQPQLFDEPDMDDDVLGYLTEQEVIHYINKVGALEPEFIYTLDK